jgi:radical SAM superfamily enzyme YgiQ (UPF0313 family)
MKVLLLNPPTIYTKNVVRDAIYGCWCKGKRIGGTSTPPYPLLLVGTILKNEGHQVRVIDAQAQAVPDLGKMVLDFDVVIILTSVMTFNEDAEVLKVLKEYNPKLKTLVFGAHPTFLPELCLKKEGVDIIIRGEGEFVIRDLLRAFSKNNSSWKEVRGIGFREGEVIKINEPYPLIENLDELPFVDWSLLPKNYNYFNPLVRRYPYVTDSTSRGCPGRCIFCMDPGFYGKMTRGRSAENVIAGLMKHISEGYKEVYFRDEMFTIFRERNRQIYKEMIKNKMDLTWFCSSRVNTVDKEDLSLMKEAGCHTIKFGVESGVQKILDNIKKDITLEQIRQTFKWCKEVGIDTHAHLMIGLPGETVETIKESINFVREINPTTITVGIVMPYPGTPLFELVAEKYPEVKKDYSLSLERLHTQTFFNEAFCEVPSEDLQRWVRRFYYSFYLRPNYIFQWLKRIKNFNDLRRILKAGIKTIDFSLRGE